MHKRQQVTVGGAIFNTKNEVLFVRRIAHDEFLAGVWELPGGGTDFGETPEEGLQREIMEECSINIVVGKPVFVSVYYQEKKDETIQRVQISFLCHTIEDHPHVVLSDEHDAFEWRSLDNLTELNMTEYMSKIVDAVRESKK